MFSIKIKSIGKGEKGFTLIELLAVIVILAILAAIAIPSVMAIINHQNDKAKAQDALTVINAAKMFISDHNVDPNNGVVTIKENSATQGSNKWSDGWADYAKKSVGNIDSNTIVTYHPEDTSATPSVAEYYSIDDPDLSGVSDLSATGLSESTLIDYNK